MNKLKILNDFYEDVVPEISKMASINIVTSNALISRLIRKFHNKQKKVKVSYG